MCSHVIACCLPRRLQVPGQGRGLFAARDIEHGEVVLSEAPMLAAPSPHALDSTCHQCLQPLPAGPAARRHAISSSSIGTGSGTDGGSSSSTSIPMCSSSCAEAAERSWAAAAAAADLAPLQEACRQRGEKFPLMLARLACLRIQQQQQQQVASSGSTRASSSGAAAGTVTAAAAAADAPLQGDPLTQLQHLCYANLPEVPQPWVELHGLLLQGLRPLCSSSSGSGGESSSGVTVDWLERTLSVEWFSDALSRLHLNSFRQAAMAGWGGFGLHADVA